MGCTYSSLSFSKTLVVLKENDITILSTQVIDACKQIYTAHILYKMHHFQLTYISGKMILSHRKLGRSKFLTIECLISAVKDASLGFPLSAACDTIIADIWKDELPERCEIRLNLCDVPLANRQFLLSSIDAIFVEAGFKLSGLNRSVQAIAVVPKSSVIVLKRKCIQLLNNPVHEWRDYTQESNTENRSLTVKVAT